MLDDTSRQASTDLGVPEGEQTEFEVANPTAASSFTSVDESSIAIKTHTLSDGQAGADELVTVPRPKLVVLGRTLIPSSVAVYIWGAMPVWHGVSFLVARSLGAHAEKDNSQLAWVADLLICVEFCLWATVADGQRVAVAAGGGLEKLGLGETAQIRTSSRATLKRWRLLLIPLASFLILVGVVTLGSILFKIGSRSKLTGRVITPLYAYTVMVALVPCWVLWFPLIFFSWIYSLQVGSVLAGEAITEVIESMERTSPRDPEWQTEVVAGVKKLVNVTLPDLSNTFGNVLGYVTLGCWTCSIATFGERTLHAEPLLSSPASLPVKHVAHPF